ncbi:uncharacterized protein Dwil_GK15987 [Drosophila willistoni]|uniref:Apoptosis regulatory protein Siva n=2 Tax=Drosophila willistoni TaxID=7260 RepID=B4NQ46_DROWI|nr:uncharacterized protein Dwil_GK15987 [Drosophila willistoni]
MSDVQVANGSPLPIQNSNTANTNGNGNTNAIPSNGVPTNAIPTNTASDAAASITTPATPSLCDHYQLLGNGTIHLRGIQPDVNNHVPNLERRKSSCCQRHTLIHDTCANCDMELCEECGYSCVECAQFICRFCVLMFGNGPQEEAEEPLCERCQMFFA